MNTATPPSHQLAELILHMGLISEKGLVATSLARQVLGIPNAVEAQELVPITTNGTTRLIPRYEPVFLLRGQDRMAGEAVRYWAGLVQGAGGNPDILSVARAHAQAMDAWPKKKLPDLARR